MASITACTATASVSRGALVHKIAAPSSYVAVGLPKMAIMGKVRCSTDAKPKATKKACSDSNMGASLLAAVASGAMTFSPSAALALVDERLSTEGTGLPFGLSNNLLGWILFGTFGLIWAFYFTYTAGLEEDEESGLSL